MGIGIGVQKNKILKSKDIEEEIKSLNQEDRVITLKKADQRKINRIVGTFFTKKLIIFLTFEANLTVEIKNDY